MREEISSGSLSELNAQGDTLNNGAPVSALTTHACTLTLMYVHVYSKCVYVFGKKIYNLGTRPKAQITFSNKMLIKGS